MAPFEDVAAPIPLSYAAPAKDKKAFRFAARGSLNAAAINGVGVPAAALVFKILFGWYGLLALLVLVPAMLGVAVSGLCEGRKALRGVERTRLMGLIGVVLNAIALALIVGGATAGIVVVWRFARF